MHRFLIPGIAVCWLVMSLPALAEPQIPESALNEKARLSGPKKAAYLMRQVELTEQQAAHAQGLIESVSLVERAELLSGLMQFAIHEPMDAEGQTH